MSSTVILLAGIIYAQTPSVTSRELEELWRLEYPKAVRVWDSIMNNFVAQGRFTFHWNNNDKTVIDSLIVMGLEKNRLYIQEKKQTLPSRPRRNWDLTTVACRTLDYKFGLTKESPERQYLLSYYDENLVEDEKDLFNYWFETYVGNSTFFYGRTLFQRMTDPTFALTAIENLKLDGATLVRISYSCNGKYASESGFVDLDPRVNWGIKHVNIKLRNNKRFFESILVKEVAYREMPNGRFFPSHAESNEHGINTPEIYEQAVIDLDQVTLGSASPGSFKLSAYGLPDIPLRSQPRVSVFTFSNPILWLAMVATVCCFLALWFLRSRRIGMTSR